VKPGDPKAKLLDLLRLFDAKLEITIAEGFSSFEQCCLDDMWMLDCVFSECDNTIQAIRLVEHMKRVWSAPPTNFTGVWTTYFVNGQKSQEIHYKDGIYFGELISFHSDGSKSVVQHYDESGCNGDDTGYFPSGKIEYRAHYKEGKPVGTWIWYNEDGTVRSTQEH
jgi:hypothetical protein